MSISALLGEILERYSQFKISCHYKHFVWFYSSDDVFLTPDFINVFAWYSSIYFKTFSQQKYDQRKLENFLEIRVLIIFRNQSPSSRHDSCPLRTKPVHRLFSETMKIQYFTLHRFIRCLSRVSITNPWEN